MKPAEAIKLGQNTPFGKVVALGMERGERYFMALKNNVVSLVPTNSVGYRSGTCPHCAKKKGLKGTKFGRCRHCKELKMVFPNQSLMTT